jgi:hypothetical protein
MGYDWLVKLAETHKNAHSLGFRVKPSRIHGSGAFASRSYKKDDVVGLALKVIQNDPFIAKYERNLLGLMLNHSREPNANFRKLDDGSFYVVIIVDDVPEDDELVVDYDEYFKQMQREMEDTGKSIFVV